jgi:hypothetical protein
MLERYLVDALTTKFGHIIDGLDADKVRLSAWKGELVFQDLLIKKHALEQFYQNAPLEIAFGRVGTLRITIPWKLVRDQILWGDDVQLKCEVVLSEVNVLITPRRQSTTLDDEFDDDDTNDFNNLERIDPSVREKQIQAILDAILLKRVTESSGSKRSWMQRVVANLFSDLTVTVNNIHLRCEDPGTSMGFVWQAKSEVTQYRPAFAVGITLKEFQVMADNSLEVEPESDMAQEAASKYDPIKPVEATHFERKRKIAVTKMLAAYWDSNCSLLSTGKEDLIEGFADMNRPDFQHSYVLDPFSPSVRLALVNAVEKGSSIDRNAATGTTADKMVEHKPPSSIYFSLPPCRFAVSRNLLEDLGYLRTSTVVWRNNNQGIFPAKKLRRLSRLRPRVSALENPRVWWKYSFEVVSALQRVNESNEKKGVYSTRRRASGWLGLARVLGDRNRYVALYRQFIFASDLSTCRDAHSRLISIERELSPDEAAVFRILSYNSIRNSESSDKVASLVELQTARWKHANKGSSPEPSLLIVDGHAGKSMERNEGSFLFDHRLQMFLEMAKILDRERDTIEIRKSSTLVQPVGLEMSANIPMWQAKVACREVSLQINDRHQLAQKSAKSPVAVISCAILLEQVLYPDGSWTMMNQLGSLLVKDCTSMSADSKVFPNLLGPKIGVYDKFILEKVDFVENVRLRVSRSSHGHGLTDRVSTTKTEIRILPLEVVYLTAPFEALSRILATANIQLSDDFHHVASRLLEWRCRQQRRLVEALADKQKSIMMDVDIGAPVLLLPEDSCNGTRMLIVDLGRLQFRNETVSSFEAPNFDDRWRLAIDHIEVKSSTISAYRGLSPERTESQISHDIKHLIEPFNLDFSICTRFIADDDHDSTTEGTIQVVATLPRLVVNVTASATRLITRLCNRWEKKRVEQSVFVQQSSRLRRSKLAAFNTNVQYSARNRSTIKRDEMTMVPTADRSERRIDFSFFAPLLKVRFENDVDGRNQKGFDEPSATTPLVVLSMRGIQGHIVNTRFASGESSLSWSARLRALDALDLYQRVGSHFSFLLSSVSPDLLIDEKAPESFDVHVDTLSTDLLTFEYESSVEGVRCDNRCNRLSIKFHELYVEWNPDTIAALQKALRLPSTGAVTESYMLSNEVDVSAAASEDEFFDAVSEEFYDVDSDASLLNDIAVSSPLIELDKAYEDWTRPNARLEQASLASLTPMRDFAPCEVAFERSNNSVSSYAASTIRSEVIFELSKLKVNFNKESRHRRLFIAEMDRTSVVYTSDGTGESNTLVEIGNLTFSDAASLDDTTLYREILGLKTDSGQASLLVMEITKNPRRRHYVYNSDPSAILDDLVTIDLVHNTVRGFDTFLKANFSPMRFVYLQQLWLEIIDYFFAAIVGAKVWGSLEMTTGSSTDLPVFAPNADEVSFTRFDFMMDCPVILLPVASCSTDYLQVEATSLSFSNHHTCSNMRTTLNASCEKSYFAQKLQWFNNCDVSMDCMRIFSSSGTELSSSSEISAAKMLLNWPIGPSAFFNVPKWKVSASFSALHLDLAQDDYSLLQHVVGLNIGEESRHYDEWHALQNLPGPVLDRYKKDVLVEFPYDKKDVTPTTFEVDVTVPLICFKLEKDGVTRIVDVQCEGVSWSYIKLSDLVCRMVISCNVEIYDNSTGQRVPLIVSENRLLPGAEERNLVYTSTRQPSGSTTKSLVIHDARIHVLYSCWLRFSLFFKGLPSPTYLSPKDVIQIGGRWYKISQKNLDERISQPRLRWIEAMGKIDAVPFKRSAHLLLAYEFRLTLIRPSIVLGACENNLILHANNVQLNRIMTSQISCEFSIDGLRLHTMVFERMIEAEAVSIVDPWSFRGSMHSISQLEQNGCESLKFDFVAEIVYVKATYSDMTVALEAALRIAHDVKQAHNSVAVQTQSTIESQASVRPISVSDIKTETSYHARCKGIEFALVDDSGRHFASALELLVLRVGELDFIRCETPSQILVASHEPSSTADLQNREFSTRLRIKRLDMLDSLQSLRSPFHKVVKLRCESKSLSINPEDRFAIEISSHTLASCVYKVKLWTCELQYNPSMIIALQRFMGRLTKDAKLRNDDISRGEVRMPSSPVSSEGLDLIAKARQSIAVSFGIETLSIGLNKEHQFRRLMSISLLDCHAEFRQNELGRYIGAHLRKIHAVAGSKHPEETGRTLLEAGSESFLFVKLGYQTFTERMVAIDDCLPDWVTAQLAMQSNPEIDDCLDVNVAALDVTYVKDQVVELIDYLTNGMPGR